MRQREKDMALDYEELILSGLQWDCMVSYSTKSYFSVEPQSETDFILQPCYLFDIPLDRVISLRNRYVRFSWKNDRVSVKFFRGYPGNGFLHGFKGWISTRWSQVPMSIHSKNDFLDLEQRFE